MRKEVYPPSKNRTGRQTERTKTVPNDKSFKNVPNDKSFKNVPNDYLACSVS